MAVNKFYKQIYFWVIAAIAIVFLIGVYYAYNLITKPQAINEVRTNDSRLNDKTYDELSKPKDYGAPISTDEAGYGRANTFAPYK